MKKTNKNTNMGMALGMCFGVSIGTSLGSVFDNTSIGISLGLCFGMAIGLFLGAQKDKEVNKQLEEQGYIIKEIVPKDNKEYAVTIVNKAGEESITIVPEGQMTEEALAVGDIVFLDEDGLLEQAYDTEEDS